MARSEILHDSPDPCLFQAEIRDATFGQPNIIIIIAVKPAVRSPGMN
jgi:hypothetical protein